MPGSTQAISLSTAYCYCKCQNTYYFVRSTMASSWREVINCPSLLGISEASSKILHRVLGPRLQEGYGEMEEGSEESYQEYQSLEHISRRRS